MWIHSHTVTATSSGNFTRRGSGRTSEVTVGSQPVVSATASQVLTTVRAAPSNVTRRKSPQPFREYASDYLGANNVTVTTRGQPEGPSGCPTRPRRQ